MEELMGPPVELKNEEDDERFGSIAPDSIVREQIQDQDKVDWARTAVAGLGMGALFGPLGLLVAGGAAYAVQDKAKRDAIMMEESRLRGARNLIDGTVEEIDYLEQISKSYTGYGAEGFVQGDLARLGLYRKQVARATGDVLSGDPRRVEAGQAILDQVRLNVAEMLDEDDRLAEKFEERRFNIREDQRRFVRDKIQQRMNVLENTRADYEVAINSAAYVRNKELEGANAEILEGVAKAALWDFLAAPVQDAEVPGIAGIAGAAGGIAGAAGGPVGAGVGSLVGGVAGTLLSGGFTDESNYNEYSLDDLANLAEVKMNALETYTLGVQTEEGRRGGVVNEYYSLAEQEHEFSREEVMYPDRSYADLVREAGEVNHPASRAPRTTAEAYNYTQNNPEGAMELRNYIDSELAIPMEKMRFTDVREIDTFVQTLRNGETITDRDAATAVADYIDKLSTQAPIRMVPKDNLVFPDSYKFQTYNPDSQEWEDVVPIKFGTIEPPKLDRHLRTAVQAYRKERRLLRDAIDYARSEGAQ